MKRDCSKRSKTISCKLAVCRSGLAIVLSLACAAQTPAPTLANRGYRFKARGGEIVGSYPALDDPGDRIAENIFNLRVRQFVDEQRRDLNAANKNNPLTLRLNYESAITRSGVISIRFEILAEERKMAHPEHLYVPLVFDTVRHRELQLKDIFLPGTPWLNTLVELTREDLEKKDLPSTQEWIEKGTAPNPGNFSVFRLKDDALEIFFPEYQVAPYGAGLQRVAIPLSALKGMLDPVITGS